MPFIGLVSCRLTLIRYPSLQTIEDSIFSGCLQLSTVTLRGLMSLRTFGKAFQGCASLVSVTLKNAPCLTTIADDAFKGCTSLATSAPFRPLVPFFHRR